MQRLNRRITGLEAIHHAQLDAEALDVYRLCWHAAQRMTLAEHCDFGEGNTTRLDELYEEVGVFARERASEARYGKRAMGAACERVIARMEAEIARKDAANEAHTADERLFLEEDGALARFIRSCTDDEVERIYAVSNAERAALARTIAARHTELDRLARAYHP